MIKEENILIHKLISSLNDPDRNVQLKCLKLLKIKLSNDKVSNSDKKILENEE